MTAITITHTKVSTAADDGDSTHVQGTDWNGTHTIVINAADLTALLNAFTSSLQGAAPASGGGAVNWLRADGQWKPPGYLATQILTAASGTYTPTAGTTRARVRMIGGGGGGGGATSSANVAVGGGGNTGVLLDFWVGAAGTALTGGAFTRGAGGAAGSTSGTDGGAGGDSTISIASTTYTSKGGKGGIGQTNQAANAIAPSGAAPAAGTSAVGVAAWWSGGFGFSLITSWQSGYGASSALGAGGASVAGTTTGIDGAQGGAGGSGGATQGANSRAGGAGGAGVFVIEEYA